MQHHNPLPGGPVVSRLVPVTVMAVAVGAAAGIAGVLIVERVWREVASTGSELAEAIGSWWEGL